MHFSFIPQLLFIAHLDYKYIDHLLWISFDDWQNDWSADCGLLIPNFIDTVIKLYEAWFGEFMTWVFWVHQNCWLLNGDGDYWAFNFWIWYYYKYWVY